MLEVPVTLTVPSQSRESVADARLQLQQAGVVRCGRCRGRDLAVVMELHWGRGAGKWC